MKRSHVSEVKSFEGGSNENKARFEEELCWCLEQLHIQMSSNMTAAKLLEAKKVEKQLVSASTPFVKKRQLMSVHFGDYRKKMAEEHERSRIDPDKILVSKVSADKQQGTFYRARGTPRKTDSDAVSFAFNFQVPS